MQFHGQDIIGCNENLEMFKSILCFMVISLKKTVPYVIKAVPIVKLSSDIIFDWILNCLKVLSDANFQPRCVISGNHQSNISAVNKLTKRFPIDSKNYCMRRSFTIRIVNLFFDTVHLIKNVRNILSVIVSLPSLELSYLSWIH